MFKRFLKITSISLVSFIVLVLLLLQSSPVQNYIIQRITSALERKLGSHVSIGHVDVDFLYNVRLEQFLVCDHRNDTVVYLQSLKIELKDLDFSHQKAVIEYIQLDDALINLQRHKDDRRWSYLMLLDHLKSDKKTSTSGKGWEIEAREIRLNNATFRYNDMHSVHDTEEFDESHMLLTSLYGDIHSFTSLGDTVRMQIDGLQGREQCGFTVSSLSSLFTIDPHRMDFSNLKIKTPYSDLKHQFTMLYDSLEDFDDFLSRVKLEAHLDSSFVSFDDLVYFSSALKGMHQMIRISGDGKGTVDNLKCKNLIAYFGQHSYFKGNASFKGLPEINDTYFDLSTRDSRIDKKDLEYLLGMELPQEVDRLGNVNMNIKTVGFLRDFVVLGYLSTSVGAADANLNFKFPQHAIESYNGTATLTNFDLGKLTGNNLFQKINGTVEVNGKGLETNTINTAIKATLQSMEWNGYTYSNINAEGTIANKLFNGKAIINDPNVGLNFEGIIDYSKEELFFDFKATLKDANLYALHLDSSKSVLNAGVTMEFRGTGISDLQGGATVPYITLVRKNKTYEFKKLIVSSVKKNQKRLISISSDVLEAMIDGNYNFNDLKAAVMNEAAMLYPDYFTSTAKTALQDFVFDITIKKPNELISLLDSSLQLGPGRYNGFFNSSNHTFAINASATSFSIGKLLIDTVKLNVTRNLNEPVKLYVSTAGLLNNDNRLATENNLEATFTYNTIQATVNLIDSIKGNYFNLYPTFDFMEDVVAMQLTRSRGVFNSLPIQFVQSAPIMLTKNGMRFQAFSVISKDQEIQLNGTLTGENTDELNFNIRHFQLSTINTITRFDDMKFFGELNGNFSISHPYNNPYFSSDSSGITIKNFQIDNDTFGNLKINSAYLKDENVIYCTVRFTDGKLKQLKADGRMFPDRKNNYLDFDIEMNEAPVSALNFIFKGIASDLQGSITGKAKLTGSFNDPELNGLATINGGGFTIDYLKTHFHFSHEVRINKTGFVFDNVKLYDENNRVANANGMVTHKRFGSWAVDISIRDFTNYKILNTGTRDNSLFYGVGFATGNVWLGGDIEHIKMVMNLKSNKGTVINIPLSNPEYSSTSSYITFKDKSQKIKNLYTVDLTGFELDLNLDITPDAYIKLIFDSQLGDVIEGTGDGNLTMKISPFGDFTMNGTYEIEQGKYVFTKYDIINKPFLVKKGGRLTWDGDPYQAKVNLEAVYSISQANASSLLSSQLGTTTTTGSTSSVSTIPVDCILFLRGLLFKPDITFNMEIPKLQNFNNPQIENTVKSYIAGWQQNPDEMNRQVFSLLFFKRFLPQESAFGSTGITASSGIYTTVGDLITSQLTNWLSQAFTNFDFGINYNKVDQNRSAQWIFKLNKKFFNDRLVLEGNYVYDGEQANNLTGNLTAQVLLDKSGQLRFTVFSKRANNTLTYNQNILTNGVGFYWRTEFDTLRRRKKSATDPLIFNP